MLRRPEGDLSDNPPTGGALVDYSIELQNDALTVLTSQTFGLLFEFESICEDEFGEPFGQYEPVDEVPFTVVLQDDPAAAGAQALRLAAGALVGLERAAATLSRREAAEIVGTSARWHSMVRFLCSSDDAGSIGFDLAETLRSVASLDVVSPTRSRWNTS